MFWRTDAAASAPLSFIVAGAILVTTVGVTIVSTQDFSRDTRDVQEGQVRLDAEALLSMLAERPGAGWQNGADALTDLGLANANRSGLDLAKMGALSGASYTSTANGLVDYPDAMGLLGIDPASAQRFHLRITPVALDTVLTQDLSHIRTAYVGDWVGLSNYQVAAGPDAVMAAAARTLIDLDINLLSNDERDALVALGLDYDDGVHLDSDDLDVQVLPLLLDIEAAVADPTVLSGDVYPDIKQYLDDVLAARLPQYDLLVVGSGADQSSLTSNIVKDAIRDWVLAGGTLLVLGSDSQNFQWLQPLFAVGTATVNGGSFAPDINHPMLREPHELDWSAYDNHGLGWDIKDKGSGAHYDDFQHVIVEDGEDVLAVSLDGAFGSGRIFLTTYRPTEIAQQIGAGEAEAFLNNVIVYADRSHLYLDYGPPPPTDVAVAGATGLSYVWDPDLGQIPVHVTVLVWGS